MGAAVDGIEEGGQPLRRMRKIGVHGCDVRIAVLQSVGKSGQVGGPQSLLCRSGEDVQSRFLEHAVAHQVPGAVGRSVVHDQDVQVRRDLGNPLDERQDVCRFVISRNADQASRHPRVR